RPQELAATLRGGRIEGAAAMALVVLPHPFAVGHAPQVVEQAPAQQGGVAPRVERQGARHELLDRVEWRRLRREGGDLPYAGLTYLGADVHEHQRRQPPAVGAGPRQRVRPAQRHADQDEAIETEMIDERLEV